MAAGMLSRRTPGAGVKAMRTGRSCAASCASSASLVSGAVREPFGPRGKPAVGLASACPCLLVPPSSASSPPSVRGYASAAPAAGWCAVWCAGWRGITGSLSSIPQNPCGLAALAVMAGLAAFPPSLPPLRSFTPVAAKGSVPGATMSSDVRPSSACSTARRTARYTAFSSRKRTSLLAGCTLASTHSGSSSRNRAT